MDPLKTQAPQEAKLHFLDYWRIIRIRKTVILAVFLLVVITATLVTFILPESFSSKARIKVERDTPDIPGMSGQSFAGTYDPYFIQTEFEVLQSEVILGKVVDKLNLMSEWGKKYNGGEPFKKSEAITLLKNRMDLRPVRNTSLIEILVYSENKDEAAMLCNAVADIYKEHRLEKGKALIRGGIDALNEQFTAQDDKIKAAQAEVDRLRKDLKISDYDAMGTAPTPSLDADVVRRLQGELVNCQTLLAEKKTQLEEFAKLTPAQQREALQFAVGPDTELSTLISEYNMACSKLISLEKDYSTNHPVYLSNLKLRDDANQKIADRVSGVLIGLSNRVSQIQAAHDVAKNNLDTAKSTDFAKAEISRPYYDAKAKLDDLQNFRKILNMRRSAETIDVNLPRSSMVEIIDRAVAGIKPVRPNKPFNIALGIAIGLIVGVGLAFFIEYLDTSVKTIDDVERTLQSPVLGVIPQNVGLLFDEGVESPHAEAYRVLRTNLLFSRKDDKLNTVAIVSAGAGEGKSTTVMNLATVFAQSNQRVLIVDSDLRRPTLHKMLRVTNNLGLTNYLLKQNTLEEVIQTTHVPSLDFMASGKLPSSSLGILSSSQMKNLISELKQRYDFVFFDSPPIMGVSDASILASEVDLALQVIQYRRYPQPMNIRAKQLIEKVGGNLVGIVLNNINMSQDESYYYYSGYYHDYYSKNEEMSETAEPGKEKPGIKQKY